MIELLVFDDDPKARGMVREMLETVEQSGYHIQEAAEYDPALQTALRSPLDLCIVDYHLNDPRGRTGLDFVRELNSQKRDTPVILLTGRGSRELDMAAMQIGVTDYLDKADLNPRLLERAVRYAVDRYQKVSDLRNLYEQVSELEQLKTDMMRATAHSVGNRMTDLLMTIGLLNRKLSGNIGEKEQRYIDQMQDTMQGLRTLTSDLLSAEQIEDLMLMETYHVFDLTEMLAQVAKQYQTQAQQQDRRFRSNLPDHPMLVVGILSQLQDAIVNLVENAIKYTPRGGEIELRAFQEGTWAVVEVTDNGYGIPEKAQKQLFSPFYRAQTPETRNIAGTGLGLYIVQSVVTKHGGRIGFESEYGKGSVFGFQLPLKGNTS